MSCSFFVLNLLLNFLQQYKLVKKREIWITQHCLLLAYTQKTQSRKPAIKISKNMSGSGMQIFCLFRILIQLRMRCRTREVRDIQLPGNHRALIPYAALTP